MAKEQIKTQFIYPPIPYRNFDWCATTDNYEAGDPVGYGRTEAEAIADLKELLADEECEDAANDA